jgi:hypothetical protein
MQSFEFRGKQICDAFNAFAAYLYIIFGREFYQFLGPVATEQ